MATQANPPKRSHPRPAPTKPTGGSGHQRPSTPRPTPQKGTPRRPAATQPAAGSAQAAGGPGSRPSTSPNPLLAIRTNWTPRLLAGARWLLAAATGETGRRVARAMALTVVLAALVTVLYDHGEAPRARAAPAVDAPAAGPALRQAPRKDLGQPGGLRGRARATPVGERPAAVAADWYAARHGVARARVKPLQQDRLSAREVRVLVLADHGRGRLRTALVRVRLGPDGWRVR
jgi:hypothetical protein